MDGYLLEIAVSPSTLGELEVTLLKILINTRNIVTSRVMRPGTISGGIKKPAWNYQNIRHNFANCYNFNPILFLSNIYVFDLPMIQPRRDPMADNSWQDISESFSAMSFQIQSESSFQYFATQRTSPRPSNGPDQHCSQELCSSGSHHIAGEKHWKSFLSRHRHSFQPGWIKCH